MLLLLIFVALLSAARFGTKAVAKTKEFPFLLTRDTELLRFDGLDKRVSSLIIIREGRHFTYFRHNIPRNIRIKDQDIGLIIHDEPKWLEKFLTENPSCSPEMLYQEVRFHGKYQLIYYSKGRDAGTLRRQDLLRECWNAAVFGAIFAAILFILFELSKFE